MTLDIGSILQNRYRIVRLVGEGGFRKVYRAWDMSLTKPVALKEGFDADPELRRQFEREARQMAKLRHPNLPIIFDYFSLPGGRTFLVVDYVEGKSLDQLLHERGGPLGEDEALAIIRQVADAVNYMHTRTPPIIHCSIKPTKIVLTDNRVLLMDSGVSQSYDDASRTTEGIKTVSPPFSAPEQYAGLVEPRSDVYSLGATLYMLLTGRQPPESANLSSGANTLLPPREVNPAVSEATSQAVVAAMAIEVDKRLPSAVAFVEALAGPPSPKPMPPPPDVPLPPVETRPDPAPEDLLAFIKDSFSLEDLKTLCFQLYVSIDDLAGQTREAKARELIEYLRNRSRLNDLMLALARERPQQYRATFGPAPRQRPKARTYVRNPRQVFISHAHQDADFAHRLAADLRHEQLEVWIAPDSIVLGERWVDAINRALRESGIFLLVSTPSAVDSEWVQDETNYAIELATKHQIRFIRLDVEEVDAPPIWTVRQYVSFRSGYELGLSQLIAALRTTGHS